MASRNKHEFIITVRDENPEAVTHILVRFRAVTDNFDLRVQGSKITDFFILAATDLGPTDTYKVYI